MTNLPGGSNVRRGMWLVVAILLAAVPAFRTASHPTAGEGKQIIDLAGFKQGLCIHLGCGQERPPL